MNYRPNKQLFIRNYRSAGRSAEPNNNTAAEISFQVVRIYFSRTGRKAGKPDTEIALAIISPRA
jgi:hypothetical protein